MDIALEKLSILDERYISPIPVEGYADDIVLLSLLENVMMSMVQKLKYNIKDNQLHVRSDKCAIFYERRSGNRWFKAKKDVPPSIEFNDELVKSVQSVEELFQILNSLHDTKYPHDQRGLYLSKIEAIQYIYKKARVLQRVYLQVLQSRSTICFW